MKLYTSPGPNPRIVAMALAEKGLEPERIAIDMLGGENRQPAFLAINPAGQLPVLVSDDGQIIPETVAICEYLEEIAPEPPLIGTTAAERAATRIALRRVEQAYVAPMIAAFRYGPGLALFGSRMRCLPEAVPGLQAQMRDGEAWLDGLLGDTPYLAGERFTLADLVFYCMMDFAAQRANLPADRAHANLARWFETVAARASARATAAPAPKRA